jgi:hypothetical protein
MTTISELQRKLQSFNEYARKSAAKTDAASALQTKWKSLFSDSLSDTSANTFVKYYRDMTRKQKGGMAPLSYSMTPGANVSVYGRFPTEVDTDMGSIRDLDVYFQNSLTTGCGTENSSLTVPVEMGSNKVGGKSRSRSMRKSRVNRNKTIRRNMNRSRRNRNTRRMRGGADWWDYRPYWASVPPNPMQASASAWQGIEPPPSGNPITHSWKYQTDGIGSIINPGLAVTNIKSDLTNLANPAPWQMA